MLKNCIACGGALDDHFLAKDYVSKELFDVKRCVKCGHGVTVVDSVVSGSEQYYPESYFGGERRFHPLLEIVFRLFSRARKFRLGKVLGKPGRVLDIGCGPGWFLDAMRHSGWIVQGTEASDLAAQHARDRLGLSVSTNGFLELGTKPAYYDVISIWHVLEHVSDPKSMLDAIRKCISDDGVLLIAVPNFASFEANFSGPGWFHLDVPRHIHHFSKTSFHAMIESAGFRARKVSFFSPEYDFFSCIQSIQNRFGLTQNLLYKLIKGDFSTLPTNVFRAGLEVFLVFVTTPFLFLASLPLILFCALSGRGATITAICTPVKQG